MNTFTLGACFQHELHTGPYFMTFAPRLMGQDEFRLKIRLVRLCMLPSDRIGLKQLPGTVREL